MRHRIGFAVTPCREIGAHHGRVGALALQISDVIVLERHPYWRRQIALEGEIDVTGRHNKSAVNGATLGKADDDTAGPMRQRPWLVCPSPNANRRRADHVDVEVGPRLRGHAHPLGSAQHLRRRAHAFLQARIRHQAFERFGMFVGDDEDSRARFQYFRRLDRVHQPFDGAIDNETGLLQRGDHRHKPLNRLTGAGGADRHDLTVARRGYDNVKRSGAHAKERKFGQVNVERTRLRL